VTAGLPWCGRSPRDWQVAALSTFREASASGRLHGGVFAACTGSGKSIHLAEVVADLSGSLTGSDVIVVTTPTVALVDQLSATIAERLGSPVGVYYTHGKSLTGPVVVTCHPSFGDCLAALSAAGRRVAFWCADEAHRTDNPQILTPAAQVDGVPRVGWSATPYKSNPDANSGLTLWQHELARYGIDDAIADGALVGWSATGLGAFDVQRVNDLAAAADRLPPDDPDREEIAQEQQEIIDAASVRWVS
jgi:superfamily II DNA or RNA helicase